MDENPYKSPSEPLEKLPVKPPFQFSLAKLLGAVAVVAVLVWLVQSPTFWMALAEVVIIGGLMLVLLIPLAVIGLVLELVRRSK